VKILGDGELTKKLTVVAGWYTRSALAKIQGAGGTAQDTKGQTFEFPKPKKKFIPREPVKKKVVTEEAAEAKPAPEAKGQDAKPESPAPAAE
jgi:hypothetical protein